ncbi:MAG: carbonic anhydrase family protein [Acidobacteriota bacterium]|nr:carbonic anhydrase family protein [Acidobacteriota bacterium]
MSRAIASTLILASALALAAPAAAAERICPASCDWGYGPGGGPDRWGEVCCPLCDGRRQSPIDILPGKAKAAELPEIRVSYRESHLELSNDGHTIGVADLLTPGANFIELGESRYALTGLHFHSLSEHTIGGRHSPMELHLEHRRTSWDLATIAVLIDEGPDNPAFAPLWSALPASADDPARTVILDPDTLLPESRGYYTYLGSLTVPNCAETVTWYVLREPVLLSAAQIDAFRAIYDHNYRPVQEPNGRVVRTRE